MIEVLHRNKVKRYTRSKLARLFTHHVAYKKTQERHGQYVKHSFTRGKMIKVFFVKMPS